MNSIAIALQAYRNGFVSFRSGWSTTLRMPLLEAAQRIDELSSDRSYRSSNQCARDRALSDAYARWATNLCFQVAIDAPVPPHRSTYIIERDGFIFRKHDGVPTEKPTTEELLDYRDQQSHANAYQPFHINPYSFSLYTASTAGSVVVKTFPQGTGLAPIVYWPDEDEHLLLVGKDYYRTHPLNIPGLSEEEAFEILLEGTPHHAALHAGFPLQGDRLELAYRVTPDIERVVERRRVEPEDLMLSRLNLRSMMRLWTALGIEYGHDLEFVVGQPRESLALDRNLVRQFEAQIQN